MILLYCIFSRNACGFSRMCDSGKHRDIRICRDQVVHGERVDIIQSGHSCEHLQFLIRNPQIIGNARRSCFHIESCPEFRILRCDADRTVTASADPVLLAGSRDQRSACNSDRIGAHGQRFRKICRDT